MIDSRMMHVALRNTVASWKVFGPTSSIRASGMLLAVAAGNASLLLDRLFFTRHRLYQVKQPVIMLGHPRSGTTFFHRLVTSTGDFSCFRFWEIMVPSLSLRAVLAPFIPALSRRLAQIMFERGGGKVYPDDSHKFRFDLVEEDELLLLWRLDTPLLNKLPVVFDDRNNLDILPQVHIGKKRTASTRFLHECFKRQIMYTGRPQMVAKMPLSTTRIIQLHQEFPDGKFVYMVRSPLDVLRSNLSQHRTYFKTRWGLSRIGDERLKRYFRQRYELLTAHYKFGLEVQRKKMVPKEQLMVIPYRKLHENLVQTFEELVDFASLKPSLELVEAVRAQAERQGGYRATHKKLDLGAFGLSREEVVEDLAEVFDAYDFDREGS